MVKKTTSKTRKKVHNAHAGKGPDTVTAPAPGRISINGKERIFLLKSELEEIFGNWPKEVDRMLHASRHGTPWLTIVSNLSGKSGAEVRVTVESVLRASQRLAAGERAPLMPSERKKSSSPPQGQAPGGIPDEVISAVLRAGELLPPGVKSVDFQQKMNMALVHWENGDFQSIRKVARCGRSTRVITVCFSTPKNAPNPIGNPSRPQDRLEPGED